MLIGNAGKDPDIRHLENDVAVVTLPIATTERFKDRNGNVKEQTEWHNVVFWRNLAEIVEKHVRKGSQVFIEGRLRTRNWEDQSGQKRYTTEIVADTMRLLGKRPESDNRPATVPSTEPAIEQTDGDDLPF
jgi:single-strand DNA-binding protein